MSPLDDLAPAPAAYFDLTGQVALVTGASRGIGFAIASALGRAGATVVLNARSAASLEAGAVALQATGVACETAPFDVADADAGAAAVAAIAARHGRLDVLVGNAGATGRAALGDWTVEAWDAILDTNLRSALFLAQAAAGPMRRQGSGRIVFTSSITGILGRATIHAYVASKAGLAGLTRSLAAELGPHGITCNCIAPGYVETDLSRPLMADPAFVQRVVERTALKRWARPEEIAGVALMLASRAGSYVTGQQIAVDGGMTTTM